MSYPIKVTVYDIEEQKRVGQFFKSELNDLYDKWRAQGYSVCVDHDNDVCIDPDDLATDDGLYYEDQIK